MRIRVMHRVTPVATVIAATLALLPTSAVGAPGIPTLENQLGLNTEDLPALANPTGMFPGTDGLWVRTPDTLTLFAPGGVVLRTVAVPSLTGATSDSSGHLWVTVAGTDGVEQINEQGAVVETLPLSSGTNPAEIFADSDPGRFGGKSMLYVATSAGEEVLDPTTTDTTDADVSVAATFPFTITNGLADVGSGTFVTVGNGGFLSRYNSQGLYLGDIVVHDAHGDTVAPLAAPVVDSSGTLFIPASGRIVEATSSGGFLGQFGSPSNYNPGDPAAPPAPFGTFEGVQSVAVDCHGMLYVLDVRHPNTGTPTGRVIRFSGVAAGTGPCLPEPSTTTTAVPNGFGFAVTVDRADNLYVGAEGQVAKYDVNGHHVVTWGNADAHPGQAGGFGFPVGMSTDRSGDVYLVAQTYIDANGQFLGNQPKLMVFRPTGAIVHEWTTFTDNSGPTPVQTAFQSLRGILVRASDGHIFVADTGRVLELTPAGVLVRIYTPSAVPGHDGILPNPVSVGRLAFDPQGNLLVEALQRAGQSTADTQPYNAINIQRFATSGAGAGSLVGSAVPVPAAGGIAVSLTGLAVRPDGSLLLPAENQLFNQQSGSGDVVAVAPDGTVLRTYAAGLLGSQISAIAIDCAGRLFVGDETHLRVLDLRFGSARCIWLPTAATGGVVKRATTSLKVTASANPSAQVTRMRIQYGRTTSYGHATGWVTVPSDNVTQTRTFTLTGLLHLHAYHYRVQVQNPSGTVSGADRSGKTS